MASEIRMSFHKRLFLMLLAFSWAIVLCFIGYQYIREKEYKSESLNAQLQQYNRHLLDIVEEGLPYEEYIATQDRPFDELRISIITLSGSVVYDNTISLDLLDNHRGRPEVADALAKGEGITSADNRQVMGANISTRQHVEIGLLSAQPSHIQIHCATYSKPIGRFL